MGTQDPGSAEAWDRGSLEARASRLRKAPGGHTLTRGYKTPHTSGVPNVLFIIFFLTSPGGKPHYRAAPITKSIRIRLRIQISY